MPAPLLGDGITEDTLLHIARFLPSARDLLCLQLVCPRFVAKCIAAPPGVGDCAGAAAPEMLSIPEEAARLWVAGRSVQERGWVPRCELEDWLGLMREVALLRVPLAFGRAHGSFTLHVSDVAVQTQCELRELTHFSVIRPDWDVGGGRDAEAVDGRCFYWDIACRSGPQKASEITSDISQKHPWKSGRGGVCRCAYPRRPRRWAALYAHRLSLRHGGLTPWKVGL